MASQPWYSVAPNDIFPEEFRLFFSGNQRARKAFDARHSDLYGPISGKRCRTGFAVVTSSPSIPTAANCGSRVKRRRGPELMASIYLIRHGQASFGRRTTTSSRSSGGARRRSPGSTFAIRGPF
jgi:hypothetical protein